MTNVLELLNPGTKDLTVTVSLFTIDGSLGHRTTLSIAAQNQIDLIVNDMPGFGRDSYGVIKLEFSGKIDGRVSFYRQSQAGGFEFAFAVPFGNPSYGSTAVGFNTFQPSSNPEQASNLVANWLSVINLADSAKRYTVKQYDQLGTLLKTSAFTVPSFGRIDTSGGHENGASLVGLNEIIPDDGKAPYIGQLIRYGADAPAGQTPASFSFAFPLLAKAGNGRATHVAISNRYGAQNWVEVVSTLAEEVFVRVRFYGSSGEHLGTESLTLEPYGQRHVNASSYLAENDYGYVTLEPSKRNSDIVQSMFYYRTDTGSISAMYGLQGREALSTDLHGSYNLFLNMENPWLVHNTTGEPTEVNVSVGRLDGTSAASVEHLSPYSTKELPLHDGELYGTTADSYGVVSAETTSRGVIFSEVLRLRKTKENDVEFIVPIPVR